MTTNTIEVNCQSIKIKINKEYIDTITSTNILVKNLKKKFFSFLESLNLSVKSPRLKVCIKPIEKSFNF